MGKLDNKVALVTGGGTNIGKGITLEFAKEGADVVVSSRSLANLEKVVEDVRAMGRRSLAIATDVRMREQVQSMVKQTLEEFGRIDILVNNSGITRRALIVDMPQEDWDDVIATNLTGVFYCIQAVARQMMERKYGKIINISSISGVGGIGPTLANYCAAKAGVVQLTKVAARELGPCGINVNAIAPGAVESTIYLARRTPQEVEEWLAESRRVALMGRVGTPEDIGKLALYLASDDSSFICGETIVIDGGRIDRM